MLEKFDKNKNPFNVPENYFAGLTEDIMNSLPDNKTEIKKVSLWKKVLPWSAAAAAVAGLIFAVNTVMNNMPDTKIAQHQNTENSQPATGYSEEEDYYMFLEEQSMEATYVDLLFDD